VSAGKWIEAEKESMKKKITVLTLYAMFLALCGFAEAQQPGKVARIGYLDDSITSRIAVRLERLRQELSKLGWVEGKISPSSPGLQRGKMTVYLTLRWT
jgi:hypothetical protein